MATINYQTYQTAAQADREDRQTVAGFITEQGIDRISLLQKGVKEDGEPVTHRVISFTNTQTGANWRIQVAEALSALIDAGHPIEQLGSCVIGQVQNRAKTSTYLSICRPEGSTGMDIPVSLMESEVAFVQPAMVANRLIQIKKFASVGVKP